MVSREDVPHDRRLPDPITLTVVNIDSQVSTPREVELTATDEAGKELTVIIWETHEIDQQWVANQTYEIAGARGKRYSTTTAEWVELHSTSGFSVEAVTQSDPTQLLVLGDTHVGYRHRSRSAKPSWAKKVNGREVFARCLARARKWNVDAVIHAGDVFDHHNTPADRAHVKAEIEQTVSAGIPFFYIYGNHDDKHGRQLLRSTAGTHLPGDTPAVDESLNLLGVDHVGSGFSSEAPRGSIEMFHNPTIAVIHESPTPVVDSSNTLLYQNDGNAANISEFIDSAEYGIDLVVSGHLHVSEQGHVLGHDTPVLVTGPTIPISTYKKDSQPSMWLLTVTEDGIEIDQHAL